jgi:hypothetical protein
MNARDRYPGNLQQNQGDPIKGAQEEIEALRAKLRHLGAL